MTNLFYYYNKSGEKMGPVTPAVLQALALQGQIKPGTTIENKKGQTTLAKNVKGLTFAEPNASAPPPVPKQFFCTNCRAPVFEHAVACMSCGAKPNGHNKFCRQCGAGVNPEQVVCIKCGATTPKDASRIINEGMKQTARVLDEGMKQASRTIDETTNQLNNFTQTITITIGDIIILHAVALGLFAFFQPWGSGLWGFEINIFTSGVVLYATVFIYPVWAVLERNRNKTGICFCAEAGMLLAICCGVQHCLLPTMRVFMDPQHADQMEWLTIPFALLGPGFWMFFAACIILNVGAAFIRWRLFKGRSMKDYIG